MKHEEISLNTKRMLAASLKKFMAKKPFSKITVSELIADCDVNRNTFYYHFEDIYALLRWMLETEAIDVVKHFDLTKDYKEAILFVMDYMESNDHILNCAYDSIGQEEMKRFFYPEFNGIISSLIQSAEEDFHLKLEDDYRQFLTEFYTEALAGILINWLKDGSSRDREATVHFIYKTVRKSLKGILAPEPG